MKTTVCIVSHTHWDREWYLPFETFRLKLRDTVGKVLELLEAGGEFQHFVLDGQAVVLEDLLELEPDWRDRIRLQVEAGRLSIGPWYILPDEFLVSGEASARNLLLGMQTCESFGGAVRVGYLPDTFGHLEQMPQLLSKAGINSFIYTRGSGNEIDHLGSEWNWQAPDGSQVLAVNQEGGYCYGSALGYKEIWEIHVPRSCDVSLAVTQFGERVERIQGKSNASVLLFNNGCDHHPPQTCFDEILTALVESNPELDICHTSHLDFLSRLQEADLKTKSFSGELLGGRQAHLLSGVWSARMPLKQSNERAQMLLEKTLEPLASAMSVQRGIELPQESMRNCWKQLLKNHPHDSICGCSIDEVHVEMEQRFRSLFQMIDDLLRRVTDPVTPVFGPSPAQDLETLLAVHNSLPFNRNEIVERWIILLPGDAPIEELELVDSKGRVVAHEVVERHWLERFWGIDYRAQLWTEEQDERIRGYLRDFGDRIRKQPGDPGLVDQFVRIRFKMELPALSCVQLRMQPRETAVEQASAVRACVISAEGATLENDQLKVWLHPDGRFDLEHLATGQRYENLALLVSREDAGDEYDWSWNENPLAFDTAESKGLIDCTKSEGLQAELEWRGEWLLPAALVADRTSRSSSMVSCAVKLRLSLQADSELLDLQVDFENKAMDHRLRIHFPTGLRSSHLLSHGQYRVHKRGLDLPDDRDWAQPAQNTKPQQDWSAVEDEQGRGLALFNRGLPEIEALEEKDGSLSLALTLLRSVGWLSRDDFPSRKNCNAGPTLATPDAQLLGHHSFRLALLPYVGGWSAASVHRKSLAWRVPALLRQGVIHDSLPEIPSLLTQDKTGEVELSAIKLAEKGNGLILRLCNLMEQNVEETLELFRTPKSVWLCSLVEERLEELPVSQVLKLDLGPCEIRTLELLF